MNHKTTLLGGIAVLIVIALAVIFARPNSSDTIKIGYFGPATGPVAGTSGEAVQNGFALAQSMRHVVGNRTIEVIYEDDACDPAKAASAATKLINVDKVHILVSGVCSGSTVTAVPIAESNKVILFTPVSESPKLTDAGEYVFRTSASSVVSAHAMSEGMIKLGFKNVGILYENAEYTVGMKDAFMKEFGARAGNQVLDAQGFNSKDTDLRTQLLTLSRTKPDAYVIFANSSVTGNIAVNQLHELKITGPVVGNAYFAFKQSLENPNSEGIYAATYKYDADAPALVEMLSAYQNKYGKAPSQDIYAALAYDGYNVLFDAIEDCGGDDVACLQKALYATQNYRGVTGLISIDEKGDTEREFSLKRIQKGTLVEI
jgi:branched-chain amino acid transport system substrate-binding protein